ncbi:MAG: PKD domain-containing protein [Acidobacteria bacterium]|nr:PKD domain-containing protein [Acidobacteriota bacterium]
MATTTRTTLTARSAPSKTQTASAALIGGERAGAYILQPSGPLTVGMGQAVSFQGDTDFGTNFLWTFGDGGTATTQTASHAFSAVGTYTVSFKASANGYLASTTTVTITVIAKPSVTSFTASPASISSGQSSTLAWAVTGATSLSLDNGIGDVTGTTSRSVTLAVSTTYTLTATNAAGSVTATVTVAVSAAAPPTITSFTASPSTIAVGHSTTLAWSVTGGASVSISSLGAQGGTSVAVTPANTTTYTLTATNAAGTATAMITVTVETELPRIADFWADPFQVASGQSTTLHWATGLADAVKLNGSTVSGASASVAPTSTTTYTLTATNLIGSVSATLTVSVGTPGTLVWTKTIVYGFGQELAEDQPGMGTTFIQSDFVGSPSFMTDASGAVIGQSKNLPFGERMSSWGQKTIRRYTNHEDDADSNAIYMQAREQLPAYGKFAQVDPAYDQTKDDPESWNLYNYTTNNPVTHTDPDGRIDKHYCPNLSASQMAILEDTGMVMDGMGTVWTNDELAGSAFESTQPSSGSTTSSPGDQGGSGVSEGNLGPLGPGWGMGMGAEGGAPSVGTDKQATAVDWDPWFGGFCGGGAPVEIPATLLSGAGWVNAFPDSKNVSALGDGFRQNVENFLAALVSAGASVRIGSTVRPVERAYLMHYSWEIAHGMDPAKVPSMQGVDIDWVHRNGDGSINLNESRSAAQSMVAGFGIVFPPVLTSRHTQEHAIDMSIGWRGALNIRDNMGNTVNITSGPHSGLNSQLIDVGRSFGVIKLIKDPPHWSIDGH